MNNYLFQKNTVFNRSVYVISYPRVFKHTRCNDEIKNRTKHYHDSNKDKDQTSVQKALVDCSTCLIKCFDHSIFWLLNVFKVKLRINDLVPDEGNPSARNQKQKECVDDHVEDPENNMGSGWFLSLFVLKNEFCYLVL